jgi:very-short-patch-repair endonuclease
VTVPSQRAPIEAVRTYVSGRLESQDRDEIDGIPWRRERLILESDGNQFHRTRRQIERDRRKEAELVRAGYRVLRATSGQFEHEPESVALMVSAALDA